MNLKFKIAAAAVALAVAWGGYQYIGRLQADNKRLQQTAAALEAEALSLQKELTANYEALAKREAFVAWLAASSAALKTDLEAIYDHDTEAKSWADSVIPDSVYKRLRQP